MKYFAFYLCLFCFVTVKAQTAKVEDDTIKKGLSEAEFVAVKKAFTKMLESEDYILWGKKIKTIAIKENGLAVPDSSVDSKWLNDTIYSKKWLSDNISKTKFKSVDEVFNSYSEALRLVEKLKDEHFDMYKEIAKANEKQRKEIIEIKMKYQRFNKDETP